MEIPKLTISVQTRAGRAARAEGTTLRDWTRAIDGFVVHYRTGLPALVTCTPPPGETLASIRYELTVPLRNFREVIVPDSGRTYRPRRQLVDFWSGKWQTRVNNVLMPVFIFTGQNGESELAFGVIGRNVETDFSTTEPKQERALQAWMKRLTLVIERGVEGFPLPDSVAMANSDGSVAERLYCREGSELAGQTWWHTLREFSDLLQCHAGHAPRTTAATLEPWWCPWTDWHSDRVNHDLMIANVRAGLDLGIRNFIIDDGWFGPGLDSPLTTTLTMGDWREDRTKFPDLRATVAEIHQSGGNCILWCAPHAVFPASAAFAQRRPLLIMKEPGVPALTGNGYHPLCFRSPEARAAMADLCLELAERYGTQGAKYDLFNNVPCDPCANPDHTHDTHSMVEGLGLLLEEIDRRTRARQPDFITELKQNYGTPWLHHAGTCMRAGDTPYNPEANFFRTSFINAYTPYSINDYQTVSNADSPEAGMAIIIAMLAAGIPTYSMDLVALAEPHRQSLKFYHAWYHRHLAAFHRRREPQSPSLGAWTVDDGAMELHFLVHDENRLRVAGNRPAEILVGTFCDRLILSVAEPAPFSAIITNPQVSGERRLSFAAAETVIVPAKVGDLVTLVSD